MRAAGYRLLLLQLPFVQDSLANLTLLHGIVRKSHPRDEEDAFSLSANVGGVEALADYSTIIILPPNAELLPR